MRKLKGPLIILFGCLLMTTIVSVVQATEIGRNTMPIPPERHLEELIPAGLDETTLELFVSAVSDLHKTALNLSNRLHRLEDQIKKLKSDNARLIEENARLRKTLRLQAAIPKDDWHSYPLDKEVHDANIILDKLVNKLTGLSPR